MSSYTTTGNKNASGQDVQGPKSLPGSAFGTATTPAPKIIQNKDSNQIIIHGVASASLHFCVATASGGTIAVDVPLTNTSCLNGSVSTIGSPVNVGTDDGDAAITVPLGANVWSGSGAAPVQGAVTLIYKGGL